jgi:pimeloyl-ACP methyl ester carboxylesterase/DNA-binding winged helix-turn-helix (wHTH) protein
MLEASFKMIAGQIRIAGHRIHSRSPRTAALSARALPQVLPGDSRFCYIFMNSMSQPPSRYEFGPFQLDAGEHRLLRNGVKVSLGLKPFEILCLLVENAGRLLKKEDLLERIWPNTVVEENNLNKNVSLLRKALGEGVAEQLYIETVPRVGYRFIAPVSRSAAPVVAQAQVEVERAGVRGPLLRQEIRFCVTGDGVRLAWASVGSGYPLVKAANWLNHLDFEWESPIWKHWIAQLIRHHRVIRYDERGNGLSDWQVREMSLELWVRDLEAVVDSARVDRFALLGISQGGAVAICYAVRHPERVSHLILHGAYSRGWNHRVGAEELEERQALETLVRLNWGKDLVGFSEMFAKRFVPENTAPEHQKWWDDLQRVSTSPGNAARVLQACDEVNVRNLLPCVAVPTIVFQCERDRIVPAEEGRILAAEIRSARFVPLPSANHILLADEPAWEIFVQELGAFLGWSDVTIHS